MNDFMKRNSPPGFDVRAEKRFVIIVNVIAFFASFISFISKYLDARKVLYVINDGEKLLVEGAIIESFSSLTGFYYVGFTFISLYLIGVIIAHYAYYKQGSMSIYLMKRLPNKFDMHRRAITLPLLGILLTFVLAVAYFLIYFAIYVIATPNGCLHDNLWQDFWRIF